MNADAIIERLEKLETWWADLGDDQDVLVVRKSDLDAAIADIRKLLAEEPPFSYTDACFLSRVYNDAVRVPPDNWINEWLKYQIATRNPRGGTDAK